MLRDANYAHAVHSLVLQLSVDNLTLASTAIFLKEMTIVVYCTPILNQLYNVKEDKFSGFNQNNLKRWTPV